MRTKRLPDILSLSLSLASGPGIRLGPGFDATRFVVVTLVGILVLGSWRAL